MISSYLEAQDLGLDEGNGTAVDLNQTTASLQNNHGSALRPHKDSPSLRGCPKLGDGDGEKSPSSSISSHGEKNTTSKFSSSRIAASTNLAVGDGGGRLLLAEALHALRRRHGCWMSWLLSGG